MIKCNVTVCGVIGRDASIRTNKEGKTFLVFPLRVMIPDTDGKTMPIEVDVSKDTAGKEVSKYRNGSRIEVSGTMLQSPNQKIPNRKTKCVIETHLNIKQNVILGANLKPV